MVNKERSSSKLFGLPKSTLNYFLIGMCLFPLLLFVWDAIIVREHSFAFAILNSIGIFSGAIGILLYVNGRKIGGILGVVGQLILFALTRYYFKMNLLKNLYFWIFIALLIFFIFHTLIQKAQRHFSKQNPD